jgi:hypothetical protein
MTCHAKAALAAFGIWAGAAGAALAGAQPPIPPAQDCAVMAARGGGPMWIGRFSGGREIEIAFDRESIDVLTTEGCFRTSAECERWLFKLRSEFQMWPRYSYCEPARARR